MFLEKGLFLAFKDVSSLQKGLCRWAAKSSTVLLIWRHFPQRVALREQSGGVPGWGDAVYDSE